MQRTLIAIGLVGLAGVGAGVVVLVTSDHAARSRPAAETPVVTTAPAAPRSPRHRVPPLVQPGRTEALSAPSMPPGAVGVADRYAIAAYSSRAGDGGAAWITAVAPICTPRWLATLRADQHTATVETTTLTPSVVANLPSHARPGAVALTVQLAGSGRASGPSIYVELVERRGDWLVEASQ